MTGGGVKGPSNFLNECMRTSSGGDTVRENKNYELNRKIVKAAGGDTMSPRIGTNSSSRRFAAKQCFGRFPREADIKGQAGPAHSHNRLKLHLATATQRYFHSSTLIGSCRSISRAWRRDSASMSLACTWSE
jgi:hypothetical protein